MVVPLKTVPFQGLLKKDARGRSFWAYGTDYGDWQSEGHGQFCINGIVFPDRKPHPTMWEAKYLFQPVAITLATTFTPGQPLRVKVTNRYNFLELDHLDITWQLKSDAGVVEEGPLVVPRIKAGESVEMAIELASLKGGAKAPDYSCAWVEVVSRLKQQTPWAPKGHVVAVDQMVVVEKVESPAAAPAPSLDKLDVMDDKDSLTVSGEDWRVTFSRTRGEISVWEVQGEQLLIKDEGPRHCLVRAHTDNDRAGFDTMGSFAFPKWLCDNFINPLLTYST